MAKTGSYIKIDRGLKSNPLWLETPFSKGQAWVDLLILAQGIDKEKMYRGEIQKMKSGTVYTSIIYLTKRWGWGRNKVYRFLQDLIKDKMVTVQGWSQNGTQKRTLKGSNNGTTNGTIITIVNWGVYQYASTNNDTNNETENGTNNGTHNGTHNIKHTKKAYKESIKNNPPKSPKGDSTPSGGYDNLHASTMMPRDMGTYDDIPLVYRDGTYQSFKTWEEYWDWSNQ